MITQERVHELFQYDPETGRLVWRAAHGRRLAGALAGTPQKYGYRLVRIDGRCYLAHRLIWLYVHGRWPKQVIDHINGDGGDNRLCNLREATHAENMRNRRINKNSTSGIKGVRFDARYGTWRAELKVSGRRISAGSYATADEAAAAYARAAREYHGEFARVS